MDEQLLKVSLELLKVMVPNYKNLQTKEVYILIDTTVKMSEYLLKQCEVQDDHK